MGQVCSCWLSGNNWRCAEFDPSGRSSSPAYINIIHHTTPHHTTPHHTTHHVPTLTRQRKQTISKYFVNKNKYIYQSVANTARLYGQNYQFRQILKPLKYLFLPWKSSLNNLALAWVFVWVFPFSIRGVWCYQQVHQSFKDANNHELKVNRRELWELKMVNILE